MKKYILLVILLLLIACTPQTDTVNVGYKNNIAYITHFVSLEKGFYEQEGLKVNSISFDSTNQMVGAIISNNIDAAMGGANLQTVLSAAQKSPHSLKLFSTVSHNDGMFTCILASEDQTIESLQNVGVLPGSFSPIWATHALKVEGNTQVDMQAISPKLQLAALESKQVDALITVEPLCTFGKNKGTGVIIMKDPMKLYAPTVAGSVISSKLVNQKPAFAKKLIRAHDKAIDFIEMNPQEAKLILIKYTKYDEQLSQGLTIPDLQKSDEINDAIIQQFANRLFEDGVLGQPMNTNELILSS